jgi:hypothetical protein
MSPALVLVLSLLTRRYPGERVLSAMRRERRARWPRRAASSVLVRRRVVLTIVRGGRLMGTSLAVRPPPSALSSAS